VLSLHNRPRSAGTFGRPPSNTVCAIIVTTEGVRGVTVEVVRDGLERECDAPDSPSVYGETCKMLGLYLRDPPANLNHAIDATGFVRDLRARNILGLQGMYGPWPAHPPRPSCK